MSPVDYAKTYHLACVNQEEANDWGRGGVQTPLLAFSLKLQTNKIHIVHEFCI